MSSEVVTRKRNSRPSLMSRELKRRRRLSLRELMQVYHYLALGVLCLVALVVWIPFEVVLNHNTLVSSLVWPSLLVLAITAGGIYWNCWLYRDWSKPVARRQQILFERSRKARSHAEKEPTRLTELDGKYEQWSVGTRSHGTNGVEVLLCKHTPGGMPLFGPPYKASWANGYDARTGRWGDVGNNPVYTSVGAIWDAIHDAETIADDIEERSFQERLETFRLALLATAMQPQPLGAGARARLTKDVDDIEDFG